MNIVREQRGENNSLIRVTVGEADYGQEVEKSLREYKRKANIPGFRPGMVPMGNPDHMVAATAKFWKEYPVEGDTLESGKWESVHAGFDPVYANNDPNRVAPYDMLKMLEKEGIIGSVYPALISTTGNSTSVADSTRMGQEIAERLVSAGVNGVILTST